MMPAERAEDERRRRDQRPGEQLDEVERVAAGRPDQERPRRRRRRRRRRSRSCRGAARRATSQAPSAAQTTASAIADPRTGMSSGETVTAGGSSSTKVACTPAGTPSPKPSSMTTASRTEEDAHPAHAVPTETSRAVGGPPARGVRLHRRSRHPAHPLVNEQDLAGAGLAEPEDLADQRRRGDEEDDHRLDHGREVDRDPGRRLHVAAAGDRARRTAASRARRRPACCGRAGRR